MSSNFYNDLDILNCQMWPVVLEIISSALATVPESVIVLLY